jgi:hypothetical protein
MKGQGMDDELDMAIVMAEVEPINWLKQFLSVMFWTVGILLVLLLVDMLETMFGMNLLTADFYFYVIILAGAWFFVQNTSYRKKYFNELLMHDFGFSIVEPKEAKKNIDKILGVPDDARAEKIWRCQFDNRETYFGYFWWSRGSGKSRRTYHRTYVMQLIDKQFDPVILFPHTSDWNWPGEDVQLESNEFNRKFIVKTGGNTKNAFYTLNPRIMQRIMEEYEQHKFNFLQIHDNLVITGYDEMEAGLGVGVRFSDPVITFAEYNNIKQKILRKLDLTANIADVLLRETVDMDGIRSQAEE